MRITGASSSAALSIHCLALAISASRFSPFGCPNSLPIAVPAAQFDSYAAWASHFNNGEVPEPVRADDTADAPKATNDDAMSDDEREALERLLRDVEGK